MNVQELNGSGRHIWAFILTAVVLITVAVLSWATSSAFVRYRKLRQYLLKEEEVGPLENEMPRRGVILLASLHGMLREDSLMGMVYWARGFQNGWRRSRNQSFEVTDDPDRPESS